MDLLSQINYYVDEINAIAESEDYDAFDEFLNNVLDLEFKVGTDRSFRGAELLVAFAGPNIYINVNSAGHAEVDGYWSGYHYTRPLSHEASDMIYNWAEEYFSSIF